MLTLAEEILLLLLDHEEGVFLPVGKSTLECALVGSVLMELAFSDRIDTDLTQLMVVGGTPTGDPVLDGVLERITDDEEGKNTKAWIEILSMEQAATIQERTLASLVERGILERREDKLLQEAIEDLWVFRSPRYPTIDEEAEREVKRRITGVLFTDEIPDPRDIALICIADACCKPSLVKEKLNRSQLVLNCCARWT